MNEEHGENVEQEQNAEQEHVENSDLTRDQERIQRWQDAAKVAPTADDVRNLRENVERLEDELKAATEQYQAAAAHRAAVFGFLTVSNEQAEPTKRIHFWKRTFHPEMEDLSSVPDVEMVREEKRIAEQQRVLAAQDALKKMLARRQERIDAAREAMGR